MGNAGASSHRGYAFGPSVAQAEKLDGLLIEFKDWFVAINGFGEYLKTFFTHYNVYFAEHTEEHSLLYTQLHKEFSHQLENSIDQWLVAKGILQEDFGDMLSMAQKRGDAQSDQIVGVLLGMLEYQLWIENIFKLSQTTIGATREEAVAAADAASSIGGDAHHAAGYTSALGGDARHAADYTNGYAS